MYTGVHTTTKGSTQSLSIPEVISSNKDDDDMEGTFPLHEGTITYDELCM